MMLSGSGAGIQVCDRAGSIYGWNPLNLGGILLFLQGLAVVRPQYIRDGHLITLVPKHTWQMCAIRGCTVST